MFWLIVILIYLGASWMMLVQWSDWLNPHDPFYRHTKGAPSDGGMLLFILLLLPGILLIAGIRRLFFNKQTLKARERRAEREQHAHDARADKVHAQFNRDMARIRASREPFPLVSHEAIEEAHREFPGLSYDQVGEIISRQRVAAQQGRVLTDEELFAGLGSDAPTRRA
jgi:hypothetical protein